MIELRDDELVFRFPEVHEDAVLRIHFQRTLRIPDDDGTYPLPPGLGPFPLRHVDDFAGEVPPGWLARGGVMLPMYQAEALWIRFASDYPFAVKIAAGKIDAVTGEDWSDDIHARPQDYVPVPKQPWLDGFCVEKGVIRQFVAMPLGAGYTAEEQITGKAEHGGIQVIAYPMKREEWERILERRRKEARRFARRRADAYECMTLGAPCAALPDMGLGAGGRMRQEIYDDPHGFAKWDRSVRSRCFVHLANAMVWRSITGQSPPTVPPTAREYARAGLPWFDWYDDDRAALGGGRRLKDLKTVREIGEEKGDVPLPENATVTPENVIALRKARKLTKDQVREGAF